MIFPGIYGSSSDDQTGGEDDAGDQTGGEDDAGDQTGGEDDAGDQTGGEDDAGDNMRTVTFNPSSTLDVHVTNYNDDSRIRTMLRFQIPEDATKLHKLTIRFDLTRYEYQQHQDENFRTLGDFQYMLFRIFEQDGKTPLDLSWHNCEDKNYETENDCKARILADLSTIPAGSRTRSFNDNDKTLSGDNFFEKLQPGYWVQLFMRISGDKYTSVLSNIGAEVTYSVSGI